MHFDLFVFKAFHLEFGFLILFSGGAADPKRANPDTCVRVGQPSQQARHGRIVVDVRAVE